jgi:SecD/SecF fusion protein
MQKHTTRTILIALVLLFGIVYVLPTVRWTFFMNEEQRVIRLAEIAEEDKEYVKPNIFKDMARGVGRWAKLHPDDIITLGLDLQGGIHMIVEFDEAEIPAELVEEYEENPALIQQQVLRSIRRRMTQFEAKEPTIQTLGTNQIQIQLPGEKNLQRAENLILKTALLTFQIVVGPQETRQVMLAIDQQFNNNLIPFLESDSRSGYSFRIPEANIDQVRRVVADAEQVPGLIPEGKVILFSGAPSAWDDPYYQLYLVNEKVEMTGKGLKQALARPDDETGGGKILFQFDAEASNDFYQLTLAHSGEALGIVLDGVCVSAPNINEPIMGNGEISGNFSRQQAQDLAIALSSGALPVPIKQASSQIIGPSLGAESVEKGVKAALYGIALVVLFMFVYYRLAGVIANLSLVVNALLVIAAMAYFDATLTLPGIAGLILTIGMAVDANVLIFERIREDIRNGRSVLASIESGFSRATVTILDANVTTLIAAAVLMEFGSGPIEGFAVTLSIGVCSSVFTALVFSRALFDFFGERKIITKLSMMSVVKPETKLLFLEKRFIAMAISAFLIIGGMLMVTQRGQDLYGVDFKTGTNMDVDIASETVLGEDAIRSQLSDAGYPNATVQSFEEHPNRFNIRIGTEAVAEGATEEGETVRQKVEGALGQLVGGADGAAPIEFRQVQTVGPAVGEQLKWDAIAALSYALVFIIAYLWLRFEFKFALGAVIALLHDVLVTVGIFAIFGREISLPVVAALLTIVGYSLNDTIVVFDRIREDLKLYRGRDYSYAYIMNLSINQTLSRTLLTSVTTLLVVLVLFFFGGVAIHDFAFALIIGVIVGTYSSIFVASPVVYFWQQRFGKRGIGDDTEPTGPGSRRRRKKKQDAEEEDTAAAESA